MLNLAHLIRFREFSAVFWGEFGPLWGGGESGNAGSRGGRDEWRIPAELRGEQRGGAVGAAAAHQGGGHREQPDQIGARRPPGGRQEGRGPRRLALAGNSRLSCDLEWFLDFLMEKE